MEKLAFLISAKVSSSQWQPMHISRGGLGISHLLFADDILLFSKARNSQVRLLMSVLNNFCEASGLKVNVDKSQVMCSKNVSRRRWDNFTAISSLRFTSTLGKYLGFPLVNGKMTKSEFQVIIDKINGKLSTWKGKLLNRTGLLCLANSVMSSIPIYLMQSLWVPQSVYLKIDSLVRNFIWSGRDTTRSLSIVN